MQMVIDKLQDPAGLLGDRRVFNAPTTVGVQPAGIDGSEWRAYPALYDADTLLALQDNMFSDADRDVALAGGVARLNASIGWQRLADPLEAKELMRMARDSEMPRVRLLLSVMPDQDTAGFSAWFAGFAASDAARSETLLRCCKLYGREPHFQRNLEAVWAAGWLPMVFSTDPGPIAQYAAASKREIVFRHVVSVQDFDAIANGEAAGIEMAVAASLNLASTTFGDADGDADAERERKAFAEGVDVSDVSEANRGGAIWRTCPPHYLVPVDEARRSAMVVRPALSDDATRKACLTRFDDIDLIATDHVAQGATSGPGLQTQQYLLPALLDVAQRLGRPAHEVLAKASSRPASLFGHDANDWAVALVAPVRKEMAMAALPSIQAERDPFAPNAFQHCVVAIVRGDTLWPTRYMPYYL